MSPADARTHEDGEEGKGAVTGSGRSKPPHRPPRPHITVYQKYITQSNTSGEDPKAPRRERKTVGHIYVPDTPPQSPPRPPTDLYKEYISQSSNSKAEPIEVEVEIKNDEGSLSRSGGCAGNTIMKKYQAPVAGEVIEETEDFEYPDWARSRTKNGKGTRKTRIGGTQRKETPRQRKPTKLRSLLTLCSGRATIEQDCSNTEGEFGRCSA